MKYLQPLTGICSWGDKGRFVRSQFWNSFLAALSDCFEQERNRLVGRLLKLVQNSRSLQPSLHGSYAEIQRKIKMFNSVKAEELLCFNVVMKKLLPGTLNTKICGLFTVGDSLCKSS